MEPATYVINSPSSIRTRRSQRRRSIRRTPPCSRPGSHEGRDIGDPTVLADIGASAGLDRARILAMLASDEGQAEVRSELQRAVNLRVSGVPTVLVNGVPLFSGAIRSDLMEAELHKAAGHVRS
jgi:predicted DsbA family dithiol-disulfide isomerase